MYQGESAARTKRPQPLKRNVAATEDLVRRAEAQHGHVRLVSGEAGERLWELTGGTIAALRFPVSTS